MPKTLLCCLCLSLCWLTTSGQASKNLQFVGTLAYEDDLNDVWGYVDEQNREYALVGVVTGVSIVSLEDPTNPEELFFLPGVYSNWRDLKTFEHYAYVTNETDDGIRIIDLSMLPDTVVYKDTILEGIRTAHNVWIDGQFLYPVGTNNFNGGMPIFDLLPDPWNPSFLGAYELRYVHDVYVRGNLAYTAEISSGRLSILDLDDPANPQVLGSRDWTNSFTHNSWLNDAGDVCFTTDELGAAYIYAWDVSDPGDIRQLDRIRASLSNEKAIPHNVHVLNDFLVTSYYRDGIQLVDAARPHNLVEIGYYDSSPLEGNGFNGVWGAYPFLPSGLVLASDIEEGLFVLQPHYVRAAYLEGNIRREDNQAPVGNVQVQLVGTNSETFSLTNGDYAIGIADSGSYMAIFQKYGFRTDTQMVNVQNGQLTELDIRLEPLERVAFRMEVRDAQSGAAIPNATLLAIAPGDAVRFEYQTLTNGIIMDPDFVVNDYTIRVGKWGYINQEIQVPVSSAEDHIIVQLEPGYYDDFALDFGWLEIGTAERGRWERGEPIGTYETFFNWGIQNPEFDLPDDIGDECYVTGNAGGLAFGDDVDNGLTRLFSPPMDLSQYENPQIQFHWWLLNWSLINGGRPGNDFLSVRLNNGIDTIEIARYEGSWDTLWNVESNIGVLEYFQDLQQSIQIEFYTQDFEPGNQDGVEAAIDGFAVVEGPPLPTGAEALSEWIDLKIAPNPLEGPLRLTYTLPYWLSPEEFSFSLFDHSGRLVGQYPFEEMTGPTEWELSLSPGLYMLTFWQGDLRLGSHKVLIYR